MAMTRRVKGTAHIEGEEAITSRSCHRDVYPLPDGADGRKYWPMALFFASWCIRLCCAPAASGQRTWAGRIESVRGLIWRKTVAKYEGAPRTRSASCNTLIAYDCVNLKALGRLAARAGDTDHDEVLVWICALDRRLWLYCVEQILESEAHPVGEANLGGLNLFRYSGWWALSGRELWHGRFDPRARLCVGIAGAWGQRHLRSRLACRGLRVDEGSLWVARPL